MTPSFRIVVDGSQDVSQAIRERLLSLRVSDEEGYRSDAVEIRLDDRGGTVELPRRGTELTVELGYDQVPESEQRNGLKPGRVPMGRYTVDEVEISGPPATLAIRAKAADMRAAMKQRRTRSWRRVLLGDLIKTIGRQYGLDARVADELAKIILPHVDQTDESDLHLLTRLGERYDAAARPANGRLVFARRGAAMSATSGALTAVRIAREQAADYRVTLADRPNIARSGRTGTTRPRDGGWKWRPGRASRSTPSGTTTSTKPPPARPRRPASTSSSAARPPSA